MKLKGKTCYMCEAPATGREHVPPKCIFPAAERLRRNLVKVPSCDEHNLRKSADDELLRHVLASAPGNNDLCLTVLEEGILPSFDRRPHILATFMPNLTPVRVGDTKTASFKLDAVRFEGSIRAIVRGLFFAEMKRKLLQDLVVAWGALLTPQLSTSPLFDLIRKNERALPPMRHGANLTVFKYDFHFGEQGGLCRLSFYEGHPIHVVWQDERAVQPS